MISDWLSVSLKDRYVLPGRREGVPGSFVGEGILPLLERPRIWFIYQRNWFSLPGVLFFSRFIAPPREEYHAPSWFPDENSKCARLRVSIIEGGCAYMKCDKWWWPRAAPSTERRLTYPTYSRRFLSDRSIERISSFLAYPFPWGKKLDSFVLDSTRIHEGHGVLAYDTKTDSTSHSEFPRSVANYNHISAIRNKELLALASLGSALSAPLEETRV